MSKRELIERELDRLPDQDLDRLVAFVQRSRKGMLMQRCRRCLPNPRSLRTG